MSFIWKNYPAIDKIFGEKWLNDLKNINTHPLFQIYNETDYLNSLNKYLDCLGSINKDTINGLKNIGEFWDVYYEFEIACFLKKASLKPKLHEKIDGKRPDIFLEEEKVVLEINHKNIPDKIIKGAVRFYPKAKSHTIPKGVSMTSGKRVFNMENMQEYLNDKKFQSVYPNIVCFCPEISGGNCDDLQTLIESVNIQKEVCILAIWRNQKIQCYFENPNGIKYVWKSKKLEEFFNSNFDYPR